MSRRLTPGPVAQRRRLNLRDAHLLSYLLRGQPLNHNDRSLVRALTGLQAAGPLDPDWRLSKNARLAVAG